MAKGVSVGDRVCVKQILGARRARAKLGKEASKVELRGRVTEQVVLSSTGGKVASTVGKTCDRYFAERAQPLKYTCTLLTVLRI